MIQDVKGRNAAIETLRRAAACHPEQRVGQVLSNAIGGVDPFYVDDRSLIRMLEEYAAEGAIRR